MWSDPIADMLTRMRNAIRMRAREVTMPLSKVKANLAEVLRQEGYILGYDRIKDNRQGLLRIQLKYGSLGEPVINELKRVSKTGCRVYRGVKQIPVVLSGMGIVVVSTSQGMMSDRQCRERGIGGEPVCLVS